jgi:hypothetical protein
MPFMIAAKHAMGYHGKMSWTKRGRQEGPSERMQLAAAHLQTVTHQIHSPWSPRDPQVEDLIDAYADPALHPDIERIARMVTWRAYGAGLCYANWTKLAGWLKMDEVVLEAHLAEMEREELIRITHRGNGAPPIIQFADGTLDALRLKKMHGIKPRERTHPRVVRTFEFSAL